MRPAEKMLRGVSTILSSAAVFEAEETWAYEKRVNGGRQNWLWHCFYVLWRQSAVVRKRPRPKTKRVARRGTMVSERVSRLRELPQPRASARWRRRCLPQGLPARVIGGF